MNHLAKIIVLDNGEVVKNPKWCMVDPTGDTPRTVCSGDALDSADKTEYAEKVTKRGGVQCDKCIEVINYFKSIKL